MDVDTERLRGSLSVKPSDELRRIVESADGEYTAEAVSVAKGLLASRPADSAAPDEPAETSQSGKAGMWSGLGAMLSAAYVAKVAFRAWREAERSPLSLQDALARLASSPWSYGLVALVAVWVWRRRRAGHQ